MITCDVDAGNVFRREAMLEGNFGNGVAAFLPVAVVMFGDLAAVGDASATATGVVPGEPGGISAAGAARFGLTNGSIAGWNAVVRIVPVADVIVTTTATITTAATVDDTTAHRRALMARDATPIRALGPTGGIRRVNVA
jgi:hypothetical protein